MSYAVLEAATRQFVDVLPDSIERVTTATFRRTASRSSIRRSGSFHPE
jgi:hypothetical protein